MKLKHKRIFAIIVKFVFSASLIHAQNAVDSAKQKLQFVQPEYKNIVFVKQPSPQNALPGNFYAKQLPFFCTKELQVQKAVGIPIKFRLGSVQDCDRLEGKNR